MTATTRPLDARPAPAVARPCPHRHALVTGASTGIGRATALRLAADGLHVFAGVRREADGAALVDAAGSGRVVPVLLDVTDPDQCAAAAGTVDAHTGHAGLDVLVDNAGIGVAAPVETVTRDELRQQLEVNVVGQVAVTQALLPAVRRAGGTVVVIGSIGDRITMPFAGPLVASKRALAGLADALRMELAPWGVRVVLVEPGSIRTAAVDKLDRNARATLAAMTGQQRSLYGGSFARLTSRALERELAGSPPEAVAAVVSRAVRSRRPRARYLVGRDARPLAALARLPRPLRDGVLRRAAGLPPAGSLAAGRPADGPEAA